MNASIIGSASNFLAEPTSDTLYALNRHLVTYSHTLPLDLAEQLYSSSLRPRTTNGFWFQFARSIVDHD